MKIEEVFEIKLHMILSGLYIAGMSSERVEIELIEKAKYQIIRLVEKLEEK